jgi:pimeloyl-ACP methyl ester carboxylesterase/DNA-binding CsgD family transcriptional regulator
VDQQLRFCAVPGGRIAYATVGSGPPLLIPALWVSHLEQDWEMPEFRAFVGTLAEHHTVVRYDRLGTGLSDREVMGDVPDVATLRALVDRLGWETLDLLGISAGGATALAFASSQPDRVRTLALFGAFAHGAAAAPEALRAAIAATVRAHWGAGSRLLADVWLPGANAALRDRFAALQRASATAEVAASTLEAIYATDVRSLLESVTAPTLVMHRREDRAIPHALARDLAAQLPNARLLTLSGAMHLPWLGAAAPVLAALREFTAPGSGDRDSEPSGEALSEREREVLALVGAGLSDQAIAAQLVLSPHTVHRHVANIRAKLRQPSRSAAAAYAARHGLI